MLSLQYALVAAFASVSCAAPTSVSHVLHEERGITGREWTKGQRVDGDAVVPVRIALAQSNLDQGGKLLVELSHPASPRYGQWLTAEEIHSLFAPAEEAVNAVKAWLTSSGIEDSRIVHSENKGWLAFDASAEEAEALFLTEFHEHEHKESGKLGIGSDRYHVPEHLAPLIDLVKPGIKISPVSKRSLKRSVGRSRKAPGKASHSQNPFKHYPKDYKPKGADQLPPSLQGCSINMTNLCYRALYGIPDLETATPGNSMGLYEQGDYFAKEDVDLYYKTWAPWVPQGTYPIPALIDGAVYSYPVNDTVDVTGECNIDLDIAIPLLYPQTVTLYQVDDPIYAAEDLATTNLFNTFLDALDGSYCNYTAYGETGNDPSIDPVYPDPDPAGYQGTLQCGVYTPTKVISMSYGQAENDLPVNYSKRQCNEFMKLGLQGHSILAATGDYGVASFPNDGSANGCLGPDSTIFSPQYPNNCAWITAVGGTMLYPEQTVLDPESVMHVALSSAPNFSTAGGFSNYYPTASYQKAAVAHYFDNYAPPYPYYEELEPDLDTVAGLYNRIGRATPDVSANGANFASFLNGEAVHFYGSSLASPLFATVITMLNEERAAIGKGPIGFVNPALYAHPEVLNDITNGTNVGCGSDGFQAVPGWDPASGLGTPNYPKMKELFLSLP
ncbi:Pro-kumamolisin, activation domain-containing protein [Xylariaceae sp. FL0804]|nr:Pro-kumamolisin, activation domain-containing protein [Xylariaceae sp. FL0804]